ncbi:MAG: TonB-dependent receptor, partial [Opitutaceae bacterium]|nr:TonB-dependent receptor [Opitutaceae bacterium]
MNPRLPLLAAISTALAASLPLPAQTSPAATTPRPAEKSGTDAAVVLSPFTVQSERDTGYQASSTLAGSRLNTPIKDIGASISVYNKAFLEDIGATNANELLIYATGMEAAGPGGNFSNGAGNNITETNVVGDSVRNAPQGGTRARGLAGPTYTRGFFVSEVAIDGYNT